MATMDPNDALWTALKKKNWSAAEEAVRQGADLEQALPRGETLFTWAAGDGMRDVAQWLLDHGARRDVKNSAGETVLHRVIARRDLPAFEWLLSLGFDPNLTDDNGMTLLGHAANQPKQMVPFIKALLNAGADPNQGSRYGNTPLMSAVTRGDWDVIDLLLEAPGIDVNRVNGSHENGYNVLHLALRKGEKDFIEKFLSRLGGVVDANAPTKSGSTPMEIAVDTENLSAMRALLVMGANPNVVATNSRNRTPLMAAFMGGDGALAAAMLERKANPNMRDKDGNNVWAFASQALSLELIKMLIHAGCDIHAVSGPQGLTPLHGALMVPDRSASDELIKGLLEMGLPINPVMGAGGKVNGVNVRPLPPPLSIAVAQRRDNVVALMLSAQADPIRPDADGETPLHYLSKAGAQKDEERTIFEMTKNKEVTQAQIDGAVRILNEKIRHESHAIFDALMEAGADINARGMNRRTPLMAFVQANRLDLVERAIVQYHADPMLTDDMGESAVLWALKSGHAALFQELVFEVEKIGHGASLNTLWIDAVLGSPDNGADRRGFRQTLRWCAARPEWVHARDDQGNTPLLLAAATQQLDLVEILLEMGADPNAFNNMGETPLMHAAAKGNVGVIYALRAKGANTTMKSFMGLTAFDMGQTSGTPQSYAALDGDLSDYKPLKEEKVDVSEPPLPPGQLFRQAYEEQAAAEEMRRVLSAFGASPSAGGRSPSP